MKCIECGKKAVCVETREFLPPSEKHTGIRRKYVCTDEECGTSFFHLSRHISGRQARKLRKYFPDDNNFFLEDE